MSERSFLQDLKKSFEIASNGFIHYFKIPDMPHTKGSNTKFDIKKPYDSYVIYSGIPMAIEAKFTKDYKSFGLKDLRPNQIKGLDEMQNAGGLSFVFLNIKRPSCPIEKISRCNDLLIFPWPEFKSHKGNYLKKELLEYPKTRYEKGIYPGVKGFLLGVKEYDLRKECLGIDKGVGFYIEKNQIPT